MGVIRKILLGLRNPHNYTNFSHEILSKKFGPHDLDVSCKGKSYLITGANGGIGSAVTMQIAKLGGTIHMVCRNQATATQVRKKVSAETGNKEIYVHTLDLSQSRKVYDFAQKFSKTQEKLDALVHIAGTKIQKRTVNSEGIECTFAVNSLAPHILTRLLSPNLLQGQDPGRVILTTSFSMLLAKLNANDPQLEKTPYSLNDSYIQSKRQLVVLAKQYAEQYPDMFTATANPGMVDTSMSEEVKSVEQIRRTWRTPEQGADTILWLAVSNAALLESSGTYFENRKPAPEYLPFMFTTKASGSTEKKFVEYMDEMVRRVST